MQKKEREELRRLLAARGGTYCFRCLDSGVVAVRHGTAYITDSAEERALSWHDEKCPQCGGIAKRAIGLLPALLDELDAAEARLALMIERRAVRSNRDSLDRDREVLQRELAEARENAATHERAGRLADKRAEKAERQAILERDGLEASIAALREALEKIERLAGYVSGSDDAGGVKRALGESWDIARAALASTDVGPEMLELAGRIAQLEAALGEAGKALGPFAQYVYDELMGPSGGLKQ